MSAEKKKKATRNNKEKPKKLTKSKEKKISAGQSLPSNIDIQSLGPNL